MTVSGGGRSSPPLRAEESFAGFLLETGESLRGVVRATGDEEPLLAFSTAFSAANFGFTAAAGVAVVVTVASLALGAILHQFARSLACSLNCRYFSFEQHHENCPRVFVDSWAFLGRYYMPN
jgi:hypothetical protein